MLGIAIVVVLLSVGILFIVANALKSAGEATSKQEFTEKQMASNILGAVLSTSTNCHRDRISTLFIDCGKCHNDPSSCRICGGGEDVIMGNWVNETPVCEYLNNVINVMLNETLGKWNKKYQFLAYENPTSQPIINITSGIEKCITGQGQGLQYVQKSYYYLPLLPGLMTVELGLCS
jgi:hypothetical protein